MIGQDHLFEPLSVTAAKHRTTPGMASWGGEGPDGTTCRECVRWKFDPRNGWFASTHETSPRALKAHRCDKACRMLQQPLAPKIEHSQPSCKYFERNNAPPPTTKPEKERASAQ
jgi:hypothetical protein